MYGELIGPEGSKNISLLTTQVLVGRDATCDVVLRSPYVSRRHCLLTLQHRRWYVQDQGSRAGVKVNGARVEALVLHPGDRLGIGDQTYEIRYESADHPDGTALARVDRALRKPPGTDADEQPSHKLPAVIAPLAVLAIAVIACVVAFALRPTRLDRARDAIEAGKAHTAAGRWLEAERSFREAAALLPAYAKERKALQDQLRDAYLAQGLHAKAADIEEERGRPDEAILLYSEAGAWDEVARLHIAADRHGRAAEACAKAGDWRSAAVSYERADDKDAAAQAYLRAEAWHDAARLFRAIGSDAKPAVLYEKGGGYREATDGVYPREPARKAALCASDAIFDPGIEVRLLAARCYRDAGNESLAQEYFREAARLVAGNRGFEEILDIHLEMGSPNEGLRAVMKLAGRLRRQQMASEAWDAYATAVRWIQAHCEDASPPDPSIYADAWAGLRSVEEEAARYPQMVQIQGVNHYDLGRIGTDFFSHTTVSGTLRNRTDTHIRRVSIRIKLFKKDRLGCRLNLLGLGIELPGASEGDSADLDTEKAGHTEVIVVRDIPAGGTRSFHKRLCNSVPYEILTWPMFGLVTD